MATSYPAALDTFTNPNATDPLSSPSHSSEHTNANDAIVAVETQIGVKHSARVQAKRTTTQSINNTTDTAVNLDTENFDTDAFHDNVTNNTRLTVPASMGGVYLITANIEWAANATGFRQLRIRRNGLDTAPDGYIAAQALPTGNATRILRMSASTLYTLAATDYVEIIVFQESGGALNISWANFSMVKIS